MSTPADITISYDEGNYDGSVIVTISHDGYPDHVVDELLPELKAIYESGGVGKMLTTINDPDTVFAVGTMADIGSGHYTYVVQTREGDWSVEYESYEGTEEAVAV